MRIIVFPESGLPENWNQSDRYCWMGIMSCASRLIGFMLPALFLATSPFSNSVASTISFRADVSTGAGEGGEDFMYYNHYFPAGSGIFNTVGNPPSSLVFSNSGGFIDISRSLREDQTEARFIFDQFDFGALPAGIGNSTTVNFFGTLYLMGDHVPQFNFAFTTDQPITSYKVPPEFRIPIDDIRISVQTVTAAPAAAVIDNLSFIFYENLPKPVPEASAVSLLAIGLMAMLAGARNRGR